MNTDNNIKIALSGQVERDTRIVFTYPQPYDPVKSAGEAWLRSIFDPREARNFVEAQKVYAFWSGPQGNYYSVIVPSPNDTRNGRLMISIFVGKRLIRNGKTLCSIFDSLIDMLIVNPSSTDMDAITELLSQLSLQNDLLGMKSSLNAKIGYREVPNDMALDNALSHCDQREYLKFRRILFVMSIYGGPANALEYTKITSPVIPFEPPKPKPTVQRPMPNGATAQRQPAPPAPQPTSPAKIVAYCIGGVVGLYLLFAAVCGFQAGVVPPFRSSEPQQQQAENADVKNSELISDNQKSEEGPNRQTDVTYFKNTDTWNHAEVKSEYYRNLVAFVKSGQIDDILATDWFEGQSANGYWTQIVEILKANPDKKGELASRMQSCCVGDNVPLANMLSELQKVVNPTPAVQPTSGMPNPAPSQAQPRKAPKELKPSNPSNKTNPSNKPNSNNSSKTPDKEKPQKANQGEPKKTPEPPKPKI